MLATVPQDSIPLREHSHLDFHSSPNGPNSDPLALEDRLCPGCKKSVVNEQGGLVVAFGQSFFHVDCFKCAKCRNQVTADTNLLLLSDGSPICANCSYSCNICHLPILDEAIMTGDDSYHAHCFKCKVCSNRIDELVFAKTSQGIYCMNCHNERMIKIRKHAQKKAERERANGGSGSSRSREQDARNFHRDTDSLTVGKQSRSGASKPPQVQQLSRSEGPRVTEASSNTTKPVQGPYVSDAFDPTPPSYSHLTPPSHTDSPSFTIAPPGEPERRDLQALNSPRQSFDSSSQNNGPSRTNTLPVPPLSNSTDSKRRSSYDDGVRPLNILLKQESMGDKNTLHPNALHNGMASTEGLSVTSRRDKRRSINPGASLPSFQDVPSKQVSDASSRSGSLPNQEQSMSAAPLYMPPSGQSQQYTNSTRPSSRPPSSSSSIHSTPSSTSHLDGDQYRSRSPSVHPHDQDDTIVMTSPPSMIVELENSEPTATHANFNDRRSSNTVTSRAHRSSATLSPTEQRFRRERRISSTSTRSFDNTHSNNPSRAASPAYRADVPHGIESGTDTDPDETDHSSSDHQNSLPPAPPPKDVKDSNHGANISIADSHTDLDSSDMFPLGDMSDDMGESLAVERMSHTTFIAPALPPIRFSMNAGDFSELLSSVGGLPSLKSLDSFAKLTKQSQQVDIPSTPPPTASSFTPTVKIVGNTPTLGVAESDDGQEPIYSPDDFPDVRGVDKNSTPRSRSAGSSDSSNESSPRTIQPTPRRNPSESDLVVLRLRQILNNAKEKGARHLKVDIGFVDAIVELLESKNVEYYRMKNKVDGMNRESKLYMDGLTVAQVEYDRELKARRDAEAEVTRLRVLLSGQAVRLTTLSGDSRRQELRQQLSQQLNENLSGLEHDLSRLKVERDLTLAEVEELSTKKSTGSPADVGPTNLGRSLTKRLEGIRHQYQRELVPLTEQKEVLTREIAELKAVRDVFLEETTALNARNEELAQLSAVYTRRIDNAPPEAPSKVEVPQIPYDAVRSQAQTHLMAPSLSTSTSGSLTVFDDSTEPRTIKTHKSENELYTPAKPKFKWPGTKAKEFSSPSGIEATKGKAHIEHNFQQLSILRFTRCDHCGDKMWGSQLRCTVCSTSIHVRCIANVHIPCSQQQQHNAVVEERVPLPPSMFGRDLTEQVHADSKGEDRQVPVIVEKCIEAVEARDYEGIYRKSGGSGQTKAITQLFERGDYTSFDLCDLDRFNDICSITSVLKTYFRMLPIPLLSFDLHDQFTAAIDIKDSSKQQSLIDLVHRLPDEHFFTLRMLMLHLHRVYERAERNLMSARNLGVVFGPTLMRSRDPAAEFSDMAGKALFIEWLVENAPEVFDTTE
ncbi:hypothetical protein CVT25_015021 [Psilocybe cyanescens]|uniref:RhoGAP-domain-containing protein n=1 Tax=Psilocybe cyanescens TaxID=93625 RepID=A0A409VPN7_PSICY|nr:hypothetical protein CVT25_015021 [Psilocybe cyanescens]